MESLVNFDHLFLTSPEPEGGMRARAQGNPWEVVWDTYMNTFDKYDSRITNAWKEDAGGLLVFTGLFSAIVGAFIIESYKKLSPDSGDQTVVLLGQISQQLAGFTNVTQPNPSGNQNASTAIILVNAMWLISLVLSITSALFATLLQQWARRYIQTPQVPTSKSQRAHVRSFLFLGIQKNKMPLAVETVPTLLHVSVFLFFAGLVIFFFTIHKGVAIAVSVSVGLFAVIYVTLTVLPYFDDKCPYRTPMSDLCWYPWHAFLSFQAYFRHLVMTGLHSCIIPPNPGQDSNMPSIQLKLVNQLVKRENALKKHWNRLKDGCEKSIIQEALHAPIDVDQDALTRLFSQLALTDKSGLLNLVASIPSDEIVHVITPPIKSGKMVFREPLTIIRNHVVDMSAGFDEDKYKSCLLVWLSAIHHITKAFFINFIPNRDPETRSQLEVLLDDIRIDFADIGRMRAMWAHSDTPIRVISRSICALLSKCLLQKQQGPSEAEIRWLSAVTDVSPNTIYTSLDDPGALDHMILKSFVCSVFPHREGDITNQAGDISHPEVHAANQAGDLPARPEGDTSNQMGDIPDPEVDTANQAGDRPTALASSIAETLAILVDARTKHIFRERILELIGRMQVGDPCEVFVANKLSQMLETPAPELTPSPAPDLTPAPTPATSPPPPAVAATVPSPAPAPASPANTLPVRSLFRTIFGARGRVSEAPERPFEPEP